jgi:hypothetical protein
MTMMNRVAPEATPQLAFTAGEIEILDLAVKEISDDAARQRTFSRYLTKVARLGG